MLIQILLNGADVLTHLRSFPCFLFFFFLIKLSLLVVYLTGSQIYEIKARVGGGGLPYSFRSRSTLYVRNNTQKYQYEYVNDA